MFEGTQYLSLFVDEGREYVEKLNQLVLDWEKDPADRENVQEIFRLIHTIKGMAATMELAEVTKLSHQLENLLELAKEDKLLIGQDFFDVVLASVDMLEILIELVPAGGSVEGDKLVSLLEQIKELQVGETLEKSSKVLGECALEEEDFNPYERRVLARAQMEGYNNFAIDIWLDEECLLKRARVYIILQNLESLGEIIKTVPTVEELEEERFAEHFSVYLVAAVGREKIEELLSGLTEIDRIRVNTFDIGSLAAETMVNELKDAPDEDAGRRDNGRTFSSRQTVRVGIERLDQLMNLVGELVIVKTRLEQIMSTHTSGDVEETLNTLDRISAGLQDVVMQSRMVPISQVFNRFPRMVRDLSRELNKEINLVIEGEETELDRRVIDDLAEPLVHIIRNSIDHGLEDAEERLRVGKPTKGTLNLLAYHEGNFVVIEVSDDGRGIDLDKVTRTALQKGLITKRDSDSLSKEEIIDLIFSPGFSTATEVSNVSGRGVGLDAVRSKVESLSGNISVDSQRGSSTSFKIRLPLTLAIIQALLVNVGDEIYALPLERVKEIRQPNNSATKKIQGQEVITIRGEILPLVFLTELLNVPKRTGRDTGNFLVIADTGQQNVALVVDDLIGQQEIVIKSLGSLLTNLPHLAGATILGDGKVALILEVNYLLAGDKPGKEEVENAGKQKIESN